MKRVICVLFVLLFISISSLSFADCYIVKVEEINRTPAQEDPLNTNKKEWAKKKNIVYKHKIYVDCLNSRIDFKKYLALFPEDAVMEHYMSYGEYPTHVYTNNGEAHVRDYLQGLKSNK